MNNKGFTLIELVLGFLLITIIIIPLFSVTLNYKEKQAKEALKADLTLYKNTLTYDIQEDLTIKGYKSIEIDDTNLSKLNITTDDGAKTLEIDKDSNIIKYNSKNYTLPTGATIESPSGLVSNNSYFKVEPNHNNYVQIAIPIKAKQKLGKDYDYGIYIYAEKAS